ncbi:MAG: hypothetical protein ACI4QX_02970, partial [Lachnospiraceae bacterium]
MYSGVLERVYEAEREEAGKPAFFSDLNLDRILEELQEKGKEYPIRSLYFRYPKDYETVCYRRGIYREIRQKGLVGGLKDFSGMMRKARAYRELCRKAENAQQRQMYFFYAVSGYSDGVCLLRKTLAENGAESEGLSGLLAYVDG